MAKRGVMTVIFFLLALIVGVTSAQASSTIDFTASVISLSATLNEASWGGGLSGGTMTGQLTDNSPIPGGSFQDTKSYTSKIYSDLSFQGADYPSSTYTVPILATVQYTATITPDAANPSLNVTWNAYLSWDGGSSSIVDINLNPADFAGNTFTDTIAILCQIPFTAQEEMAYPESFYVVQIGHWELDQYPVTLTLNLEQSGQSAASAVPVPGSVYLLGSGLVVLVGRKFRLRSDKP